MALLAALYHRDALGGGGQVIDNAMAEANLRLIEYMVLEHDQLGIVPQRQGNRLPGLAPRNAYPTREGGYIAISGGTQSIVERLFRALGRPELLEDPRLATAAARVANVDALDAVIGGWIVERTIDEVLTRVAGYDPAQIERLRASGAIQDADLFPAEPDADSGELQRGPKRDAGRVDREVTPKVAGGPGGPRFPGAHRTTVRDLVVAPQVTPDASASVITPCAGSTRKGSSTSSCRPSPISSGRPSGPDPDKI